MNTIDREHLKLLSVFHYVLAGLAGLFALFPVIHLAMGILLVSGSMKGPSQGPPMESVGWLFVFMGGFMILFGFTLAGLLFTAGRRLAAHRSHTFCLVVAGLSCLFAPFGTVLGVCTFVVLLRESVKAGFDRDQGVRP